MTGDLGKGCESGPLGAVIKMQVPGPALGLQSLRMGSGICILTTSPGASKLHTEVYKPLGRTSMLVSLEVGTPGTSEKLPGPHGPGGRGNTLLKPKTNLCSIFNNEC